MFLEKKKLCLGIKLWETVFFRKKKMFDWVNKKVF